jgi:hypothetical protein
MITAVAYETDSTPLNENRFLERGLHALSYLLRYLKKNDANQPRYISFDSLGA